MVSNRPFNFLGLFDHNAGLTTKFAMVKVSENVKEETLVDMTNKKHVLSVSLKLKCPTNQIEILHRAASKVFTGCLSSTPIPLLLIETQLPQLKITLKH